MGRVISDGIFDAYIPDSVILPEYRGRGYGKKLVKKLLEFCKLKGIIWIGLIAEPDQYSFYSRVGFKKMDGYTPMIFNRG